MYKFYISFFIKYTSSYNLEETNMRCKQYGIVDQDCTESVYYPRQEYDNFLRSFKMPIQKDPECEKQKCFVNVNDVSSIIQVIPKNIPNPICIDKPKSTASPKKGTKIQK
ncbi:hypothetical protein H311_05017, partial [Anncaliia algerae PRA109]